MANSFAKLPLSASINGKQIPVAATTSASATPIHTAVAGTTEWDEVWLYAYNDSGATIDMAVLWGGNTEPNDVTRATIQPRAGRTLLIDGGLLQNGLTVSAYAQSANVILISGYVNRITPL